MSRVRATADNILVIDCGAGEPPELIDLLRRMGKVQVARSLEAAVSSLQQEHFDVIVSPSDEMLRAGMTAMSLQLGAVLNSIELGVCIVGLDGQTIWCNSTVDRIPDSVREAVRQTCAEMALRADDRQQRTRSMSLDTPDDRYFDVTITSLAQGAQPERLVAVITEVTRARRLQKKVDAIDNAGRELVRFDAEQLQKLNLSQRLALLEEKILRYTRELLAFDNFCIRLLNQQTRKLELVLCAGLPPEAQESDIYASTENSGISGYVAATGRSYVCPDVRHDPRYLRGINEARSSLTVPLYLHDQVIGILNIESAHDQAFSEDDRQFAEIFGRYVAIALHILDVLVVERHVATGRLRDDVAHDIAEPLNDILCDASTLMEDYIGHDDLRHRLQAIAGNVGKIRESVKQAAKPVDGILGARPADTQRDPVLDGRTILVIDDEELIRESVRDVLAKYGANVETAGDGEEGLALVHQRGYDLVLSDIRLPNKNGYEIFREVRAAHPQTPVIFMTGFGYDPSHSIIRAEPEGLAAVLFKPFKVDELLKEVRTALGAKPEAV